MARSVAFETIHSSSSLDATFRVVTGDLTGFSLLTGLSVAVVSFCGAEPGLCPGADDGGGPLLLTGVSTLVSTGVNVAL